MKTYNYDGYEQILENVKSIIQSEPLTEVEKDSLITKIDTFQDEIENLLMGRGARAVSYDNRKDILNKLEKWQRKMESNEKKIAEHEMHIEQLEIKIEQLNNYSIRLP
jgi:peptidoglycan hydrolase CwlO-like protein|tara:strand:+ start:287 stop:610 length:324 start_codon:yes stop_codon:yes gene_type:complete